MRSAGSRIHSYRKQIRVGESSLFVCLRGIMDKTLLEKAENIFREEAENEGLEVVSIRYFNDPLNGPTLEVLIDKDFQITIDEIEKYTDAVSPLIDELDIPDSYLLDIGSGGSERDIPVEKLEGLKDIHVFDVTDKNGNTTRNCTYVSSEEGIILFTYFVKGKKTKLKLKEEDIRHIKMGYKA